MEYVDLSQALQQQAERIRALEDKIKWFEREQAAWREFTEKAGNTVERAEQQLSEVVEYAGKLRAAADTCDRECIHKALKLPLPKAMQGD